MQKLNLQSDNYNYILKSFGEWLDILGYAPSTVYGMPLYIKEFLYYLERTQITHIKFIENKHIKAHYRELKQRANVRRGGALSNNSLNKHIQALNKFSDYLRQSGKVQLPKLHIQQEEQSHEIKHILTQEEIKQLYKACENNEQPPYNMKPWLYEALTLRDKAMLTVFYGCGLRRTEAVSLDINDIHSDKKYIHVKKGKNYKERIVPINTTGLTYLQNYLYESRPYFLLSSPLGKSGEAEEALFISQRGIRMNGQSMLLRLKLLIQRVNENQLETKETWAERSRSVGLHSLRHSIATHLLSNGMSIDAIAKFLGHSSLESTQIYTHLVEQEHE